MADISQICIARILNVMEQCGKKAISDKALYGKYDIITETLRKK